MLEDYLFAKNSRYIWWGLFALIVAFLVFHAGIVVGKHQPHNHMSGNHALGPLGGFMPQEGYIGGHGAIGTIATVTLPTFTMTTRSGEMQIVETSTSTIVIGGQTGTTKDLLTGKTVIVLGDPQEMQNENDLDARVIKILPL